MQEFNPFYLHLVLYDRKPFCSILTDFSNVLFLFHQKFPMVNYDMKNVLIKQFPKNAEAAVYKYSSEAFTQRCSVKKMFLEILQNSQESTCTRVSLLRKLQVPVSIYNFIKKGTLAQVFSCESCEISKNIFFTEHLLATASCFSQLIMLKYFSFLNIFFNRFFPVEKCGVNSQCLCRDSLTLMHWVFTLFRHFRFN